MVTFFVFILILVDSIFVTLFFIFSIFFAIIVWLETTLLLVVRLRSESSLRLAHFTELLVSSLFIIFKNLILLVLLVLVFQLFNDCLGLLFTLTIFKVVSVQLVFQVVDICVLFHIDSIETLKFLFQAFVFFLILWFNVFNTLQSLFSSFQLLTPSLNFVLQLTLVLAQLFNSLLHFTHLFLL